MRSDDQNPTPELHCSFCNKSQRYVRRLVAGPDVYICDECIEICTDIVAEVRTDALPDDLVASPTSGLNLTATCALCHMTTPREHTVAVRRRGPLCVGCIGAIEEAVAADRERRNGNDDAEV
jgi:hypothetical protein